MAPEALKNGIYRGGRWLLGTRFTGGGLSGHTRAVFDDHVLLRMFADHAAAGTAGAGVSYLRLESTRTPARLSGDCRVVRASDTQATDAPQQARCALLDVALLVDSLRRKGLYDSTAIVILADTGTPSPAASLLSALDSGTIPGAARPLLLIKPRRSRGPLRTERTALQTADIPKTLCALSGHCSWPRGVAALDPAPVPRSRDFLVYDDDTINTLTGHIDNLQRFRLSGPVDDPGSWNRLIDTSSIEAESRLEFSALDDPGRFGSGWGIVESDPYSGSKRWVVAESATLSLELQTAADYLLEFTLYPPPDLASQRMDFEINGHWLGARELLPGISTVAIRVPAAFIHPGVNELALRFALLADPTGLDERPLAMSFLGLAIGRVVPGQEVEPL
jgi:hypothetical protein